MNKINEVGDKEKKLKLKQEPGAVVLQKLEVRAALFGHAKLNANLGGTW
jgi:hypothetical protein